MIKIVPLNQRPPIPEKVLPGSMLDLEGAPSSRTQSPPEGAVTLEAERSPEADACFLPFQDQHFQEVKVTDPPFALLNGEKLRAVLGEAFRVLEPGGRMRIDTEVSDEAPAPREGEGRSLKLHWLKEVCATGAKAADLGELTQRMDESGFEEVEVWQDPAPASYRKITLIAVKPGSK